MQVNKFLQVLLSRFLPITVIKDKDPCDVDFKNRTQQLSGIISIELIV